jgi:amidase
MTSIGRRAFLEASLGAVAAAPFAKRASAPPAARLDFATAGDAAAAIQSGAVSSLELTERMLRRIEAHNPKVNAVVTVAAERALARAKEADAARARGERWGSLHGVPCTVKDLAATAGIRTTSGSLRFKDHVPSEDDAIVARLRLSGAVILGKTNTPEFGNDYQTYNDVFGTTNNPWNSSRTSGGSSGGCASALASGLTYLSIGSDMGGSIRCPAHFCGVYGHRPTLNVIPDGVQGSIEGSPISTDGPLARSAADLRLAMGILGGPAGALSLAYKWSMPSPRRTRLREYRLGAVLDDPTCPVTPEVAEVLAKAVEALRREGVAIDEGWPSGISAAEHHSTYIRYREFLSANRARDEDMEELERIASAGDGSERSIRAWAWTVPHKSYIATVRKRVALRDAWQKYFETHDAFLLPVCFTTAFPHDHSMAPPQLAGGGQFDTRVIPTSRGPRPYLDYRFWPGISSLTGLPATSAFAGLASDGLPVGIQILGPYLEDATPIDIAARLADVIGGFQVPPGFDAD